ncbi:peroxisomal biogenesis factor [Dichomitus squalens]|uniref:Peroxisomal biogenesis factor n=1 Tax=Dichomitus squalens TaxID=114155 RepID=A0A4Q9N3E8_9APHY|nr:peroxisomal biogenesis factor [Dichomitus squalens LYAD-421 SS1]EJF66562.1 peroxisomal biogenesis factor [Dichomitus squalens LYAD-421 SS1]TBU35094.1 peroxisomal biogenesis factor [Dichomitus squalens]TBU49673.1 peroxisomal biogenesis factor [Dichomitus squalens]
MASIASQVILHPVTSQSLKVLSTTIGRDKLYRAIQYFARFFAWSLLARGYKIQAARWDALKSHLALGRKLLRLGKSLENAQAALRAISAPGETGERITAIGRQLGYFGYLSLDNIGWAHSIKFYNLAPSTAQKINKRAMQFWFTGIVFSIVHGLLKAGRLANEVKQLQGQAWSEKSAEAEREHKLRSLQTAREDVRYQFILDLLDVWIPATNIGLVNLNDGILGIFGFVTSLMALRQQWLAAAGRK